MLASAPLVQARDWADIVTTPLVDPLLARPPELDTGKTLPGDDHVYGCNGGFEPARPLTLPQAVDQALCHNPRVESAWAAIKMQAAEVGEARAAYLPTTL